MKDCTPESGRNRANQLTVCLEVVFAFLNGFLQIMEENKRHWQVWSMLLESYKFQNFYQGQVDYIIKDSIAFAVVGVIKQLSRMHDSR